MPGKMKDGVWKTAKCRIMKVQLQTQRKSGGENGRLRKGETAGRYNCPFGASGRKKGKPGFLKERTGGNPSGNIKLSDLNKNDLENRDSFVQRDEFAICEEKVAKKS
jgi:hypothetical protein